MKAMNDQRSRRITRRFLLALLTTLAACASDSESPRAADPEPGGSGADVVSIDVCARIPVADVAEVLGEQGARGSAKLTQGSWATDCTYSFERDAFKKFAIVYVYPVELWAPEEQNDTEKITGLGDAAYLTTNGISQMHVLVDGVIYIDARADTPEEARRLAELALARLTG